MVRSSNRREMVGCEAAGTFRIPYESKDFPPGTVEVKGCLEANWNDLISAALTVGRPNTACVFRHGKASLYEAMFRLSLLRMALEVCPFSTRLYRTAAFRALDPSEKGAVSYFLGMAVCKLFAERLLDTPWLLHLDVFQNELQPRVREGRSRPDLVGEDQNGAWHVFECKGRSSVPNADELRKAKEQAGRLVRVNSTDCALHVGAISYFRQNWLEFYWRDPEPDRAKNLDPLKVNVPDDALKHYYAPSLALYRDSRSAAMCGACETADLKVEIHAGILEQLQEGAWEAARLLALDTRSELREEGFRPDGLKVTAGESWVRQREVDGKNS